MKAFIVFDCMTAKLGRMLGVDSGIRAYLDNATGGFSLPLNLGLQESCRRFSLSPSDSPRCRAVAAGGEGVGQGGPSLPGGSGARWQTKAGAASRRGGLLSPPLCSKGGEGDQVVGWWRSQETPVASALGYFSSVTTSSSAMLVKGLRFTSDR